MLTFESFTDQTRLSNSEVSNKCGIAIMAKAPIAGYCKTRLIPYTSASMAAGIQQELMIKTVETAISANTGPVTLWCTPHAGHRAFIRIRQKYAVRLKRQIGQHLGQRMLNAIRDGLKHQPRVVILGTDCPALTVQDIHTACQQLESVDHVFQPAEDGGYVLAGTRNYAPRLFRGIPWGNEKVMDITRRKLRSSDTSYCELPILWDVDEINDLKRARKLRLLG